MGKPLRTLLVRIVLEKAIIFEERAHRYYRSLLEQTITKDIFDLIMRLSGEELHHRIMFEEMQRKVSMKGVDPIVEKQLDMEPLMTAELEALCEEWPVLTPEDSIETILRNVLQKERCGCEFYRKMARLARQSDLTNLFRTILLEEIGHAREIEEELKKITS